MNDLLQAFVRRIGCLDADPELAALLKALPAPWRSVYIAFVELKPDGLCLVFNDAEHLAGRAARDGAPLKLVSLHVYGREQDGYAPFRGGLPDGFSFDASREEIAELVGPPERYGGNGRQIPFWARFARGSILVHLTYGHDGKLVLITITDPSEVT
jgi:hypothetical protein